jgi:hypothetical protein
MRLGRDCSCKSPCRSRTACLAIIIVPENLDVLDWAGGGLIGCLASWLVGDFPDSSLFPHIFILPTHTHTHTHTVITSDVVGQSGVKGEDVRPL